MMDKNFKKLQIIGMRGKVKSSDEFLKLVRTFFQDEDVMIQFFNADMILGEEHIVSAYEHARRAFETRKNISLSLAMELLIYVSGEIQIASAIKKVGITDNCERIAMVTDDKIDIDILLKELNMERDDEVLTFYEWKLREFGFTENEISAASEDEKKDLVLEHVAMVDVKK